LCRQFNDDLSKRHAYPLKMTARILVSMACLLFWPFGFHHAGAAETSPAATNSTPSGVPEAVAADKNVAYLFTSFDTSDQSRLRFLYSFDGYHWTNVPGTFLNAGSGSGRVFRDPSCVRGPDGAFHLVWTAAWRRNRDFGYASSRDLIHWSEPEFIPVMTNEPAAVNVWAPELFYDAPRQQFIITWASTIPGRFPDHLESSDNNHRLYYATTRDFKSFTPAKLFFEPGYSVIDAFILQDGNRYVLVHKDNTRPVRALRVAFGNSPLGPWRDVSAPFTEGFTEGPCALKIGDDWLVYFDAYRERFYGAVKTRDFRTFVEVTKEVSFPEGHKHGTALRVPREILDGLLQNKP
jgi:hypothetical protein